MVVYVGPSGILYGYMDPLGSSHFLKLGLVAVEGLGFRVTQTPQFQIRTLWLHLLSSLSRFLAGELHDGSCPVDLLACLLHGTC